MECRCALVVIGAYLTLVLTANDPVALLGERMAQLHCRFLPALLIILVVLIISFFGELWAWWCERQRPRSSDGVEPPPSQRATSGVVHQSTAAGAPKAAAPRVAPTPGYQGPDAEVARRAKALAPLPAPYLTTVERAALTARLREIRDAATDGQDAINICNQATADLIHDARLAQSSPLLIEEIEGLRTAAWQQKAVLTSKLRAALDEMLDRLHFAQLLVDARAHGVSPILIGEVEAQHAEMCEAARQQKEDALCNEHVALVKAVLTSKLRAGGHGRTGRRHLAQKRAASIRARVGARRTIYARISRRAQRSRANGRPY